jgi:homogentisate phytyltransferase / homogentisate geranylgeranyltransferase
MNSVSSISPHYAVSANQSGHSVGKWLRALYRFSRPESTLGSVVMSAAICVALLPAIPHEFVLFTQMAAWIVAVALWTIASHGINQIYDLPVDRINKPDFPLPSGVMTVAQAWAVSLSTGVVGSILAWWIMPLWLALSFVGFMTWATITYSIPRFGSRKIRQSPWLTKLFTLSARGVIFPAVGFLTASWLVPTLPQEWVYLGFILTFAVLFCVGMNTFEDIPDMRGDREGGYRSFALALGATKTAFICLSAFVAAFLGLATWMLAFPHMFHLEVGLMIETLFLIVFIGKFIRLLRAELQPDGGGAKPFYAFLWRLYTVQYLALILIFAPMPLARF